MTGPSNHLRQIYEAEMFLAGTGLDKEERFMIAVHRCLKHSANVVRIAEEVANALGPDTLES